MGRLKSEISPKAQLLEELFSEVVRTYFALKRLSGELDFVSDAQGGSMGIFEEIALNSPVSIPEIARKRDVSRQYVQKMVQKLLKQGLISAQDNPAHRRAKLYDLSDVGEAVFQQLANEACVFFESAVNPFEEQELDAAKKTLEKLRTVFEAVPPIETPK